MAAEDVELIRAISPGPDDDLAALLNDDQTAAQLLDTVAPYSQPSVQATIRLTGMAPVTYTGGLEGLRDAWRNWLRGWSSFHAEIEDVLDAGDRVVVVFRGIGRRGSDDAEATIRSAAVWRVMDGRVSQVDFNVPRAEALAMAGLKP